MLSYQFRDYGGGLEPIERSTPGPQGSEVLVAIEACGVCHSDLHIHKGSFELGEGEQLDVRANRRLPFTLGHEIAGSVAAAGPEADARIGTPVVVYPWIGCGACSVCLVGNEQLCSRPAHLGINVDGGFASHVVVPNDRYLVERGDLPADAAGPLACSTLTAYSALAKVPGGPLLVIGAGGVGLAAIAQASGSRPLVAADVSPRARQAALDQGADMAIDPLSDDGQLRAFTDEHGRLTAVLDFVGTEDTVGFGFRNLSRAGSLVLVGMFGGELRRPLPYFPMLGHSLIGSNTGTLAELQQVVTKAQDGSLRMPSIQRRWMSEADQTLHDLANGSIVGRAVLVGP